MIIGRSYTFQYHQDIIGLFAAGQGAYRIIGMVNDDGARVQGYDVAGEFERAQRLMTNKNILKPSKEESFLIAVSTGPMQTRVVIPRSWLVESSITEVTKEVRTITFSGVTAENMQDILNVIQLRGGTVIAQTLSYN